MEPKGFLASLFDTSFANLVTPRVIRIIYIISMVVIGLAALFWIGAAFSQSAALGLLVLVIAAPIVSLLYLDLHARPARGDHRAVPDHGVQRRARRAAACRHARARQPRACRRRPAPRLSRPREPLPPSRARARGPPRGVDAGRLRTDRRKTQPAANGAGLPALRSQGRPPGENGYGTRHSPLWLKPSSSSTTTRGSGPPPPALLELEGYEVVGEAEDGLTAIAAARELRPDFILLDVKLPDVDGSRSLNG